MSHRSVYVDIAGIWQPLSAILTSIAGNTYLDGQVLIGSTAGGTLSNATLTPGAGVTITNGPGTITIASSGAVSWSVVTGATNATVNSGYFCNHAASRVVVTLPDTAPVGSVVRIAGMGAAGWEVAQNAGETIYIDSLVTTTGVTGKLQSSDTRDCVEMICFVADTDWLVVSSMGNIVVA